MQLTFIHKVSIQRRTAGSANEFGEPTYTYTTVYSDIKARVEEYQPEVSYGDAGQDPHKEIIIYFPNTVSIQAQDIVLAVSVPLYEAGDQIGRVKDVAAALSGTTDKVHHYEATIES